jgi:hypothetical protein
MDEDYFGSHETNPLVPSRFRVKFLASQTKTRSVTTNILIGLNSLLARCCARSAIAQGLATAHVR